MAVQSSGVRIIHMKPLPRSCDHKLSTPGGLPLQYFYLIHFFLLGMATALDTLGSQAIGEPLPSPIHTSRVDPPMSTLASLSHAHQHHFCMVLDAAEILQPRQVHVLSRTIFAILWLGLMSHTTCCCCTLFGIGHVQLPGHTCCCRTRRPQLSTGVDHHWYHSINSSRRTYHGEGSQVNMVMLTSQP
jgi:hypothetical protein